MRQAGLTNENLPVHRVQYVIQHEGFLQFAFSRFGGDLPIWVNEGLAEFFAPHDLVVRWSRDRTSGALRYEIEVR